MNGQFYDYNGPTDGIELRFALNQSVKPGMDDDPLSFCRIFRKHTGLSPIEYRNKQRDKSG